MASRGDACRYRSISGETWDAVLAYEPRKDVRGQYGAVAGVEVFVPGVREPVKFQRVEWVEREPPRIIVCVAWPKEA